MQCHCTSLKHAKEMRYPCVDAKPPEVVPEKELPKYPEWNYGISISANKKKLEEWRVHAREWLKEAFDEVWLPKFKEVREEKMELIIEKFLEALL